MQIKHNKNNTFIHINYHYNADRSVFKKEDNC